VAVDSSGNIFFSDGEGRIREINTDGIISTVAGGGNLYPGDGGAATNALLNNPQGVSVDAYGSLFIADSVHNRIRKVNVQGPTFLATNVFPIVTNYDVVISSPYGSVTSSFATITEVFGPGIAAEFERPLEPRNGRAVAIHRLTRHQLCAAGGDQPCSANQLATGRDQFCRRQQQLDIC
jgi:hypothetical protein